MKKFIYATLIGLISIGIASCDLLNKQPLDQLSSESFWQSEGDFQKGLTAIYGGFQDRIFSWELPNLANITDNAYGQHNYFSTHAIKMGNITPTTGGYISAVYNTSYEGIARINLLLSELNKYEGSDLNEQEKLKLEAEARFIRGYYYWRLYFFYGSVPVVTQPLNLETQSQPKSPAEEVLSQVLSDLNFAVKNLPSHLYNNGHAVKTSAQALKARVLLYAAYDENGNPDPAVLTKVRDISLQIMDAGYELDPNFADIFRTGTQENSPGIIFSIKFLAPNDATAMDQHLGDWLVVSPRQDLIDAFEKEDPRLDVTIFEGDVNFDGIIHTPSNNMPTGYGVKKFLSPDLIPYGYSTLSEQDWVVLRYAEVLLMYAEAQNELQGPDQTVYDAINAVRSRVGLSDLQGLSQEQMRKAIRHERRVELAFEGLRYYDLKRWRTLDDVYNSITESILTYNFEERFYLWPLPQSAIEKSNSVLKQNPDYQ